MDFIYLDAASTELLHPLAKLKMIESFDSWANPSSLNEFGKKNGYRLEECRLELKNILNVKNNAELFFVGSASEANNIVFNSCDLPVLVSDFEHPSCYKHPKAKIVDLQQLEEFLKKERYLVSVSLVNNESGMLVWNQRISELVLKYGSKLHVDASQGKNIDFDKLRCDYMTVSSHKIGGPVGVAAVVSKPLLKTAVFGGGQEFNVRSGTQPLPLIEGFLAAAKELVNRYENDQLLFDELKANIDAKYFFSNFVEAEFCNHIVCLMTYDRPGTEVFSFMDFNNIAISFGSACSSGAFNAPAILQKFDVPSFDGIRVSFGWHSTLEDVQQFARCFNLIFNK